MPPFNGTEGLPIATTDAAAYTAKFRKDYPNNKKAYFIGVDKIRDLLAQAGTQGIRIYLGVNSIDGAAHIMPVLVAADANEEDIIGICLDEARPCPPACATNSPLMR